MFLKKLIEQRDAKRAEMEAMLNKAETEERALTEEEIALFDEAEKEVKGLTETIQKIKDSRELTEEEDEEAAEEEKTEEQRALEEQRTEKEETKLFANYIRNVISKRADANLEMGANGDVVPVTIARKIISRVYDISPILEKATKYITKGKLEIPQYGADDKGNDIQMAYANEFTDLESKIGKLSTVELSGYLAGALCKLSNSLINNTDIDIVNKVIELMAEAIARFMEKECLVGTADKVVGCSSVTLGIVAESATAITADDLIKLKNKVKKAFRKDSIWIMSNDTLTAIELLKDENGRPLFNVDLTGEYDGKILGYPVYVSDNMVEIAAGAVPVLFGDFSGLALKQSVEVEMQILREKFATQHATGIVAWTEFDADIENAQKIAKLTMGAA